MSNIYYDGDEIIYCDSYKDYRNYIRIPAMNDEESIDWYEFEGGENELI